MVLIIFVFYFITIGYLVSNHNLTGWESAIKAFLITYGATAIIVELLSIFDFVTIWTVFISWCLITTVLLIIILRKLRSENWKFPKNRINIKFSKFKDYSSIEWIIISSILGILLFTFIIAVYSPPNNFDSMTYHMARVVHWIQQKSVKFYPTSIPRQNYSMPLAEYQILQLQLLSRSDKFANLVQWTGFVMLIGIVSEFTKLLLGSRKGQLLASLFAVTIPMAILQSTNTQNDISVSVFCLIFAYFLLKTIKSNSWIDAVFGGLALGLALLTKGTAYIYCAAIGLVYGFVGLISLSRETRIKLIQNFSIMIFCALILNLGFYQRNMKLYGHPLSSETGKVTVNHLSLPGLYSNIIRNSSMHLAVPIPTLTENISDQVIAHLGDLVDDQGTTFPGTPFQIRFLINDDESGNPIHLILMSVVMLLLLTGRRKRDLVLYTHIGGVIFSILLFSLVLKWQPWGSRLQLPIFILGAPLVGFYFDKVNQSKVINFLISGILIVYCIPFIFLNSTRPLIPIFSSESPLRSNQVKRFFSDRPNRYTEYYVLIRPFLRDLSVLHTDRQTLYFLGSLELYQDYLTVMTAVNDLDEEYIGLYLNGNDWEYPIWALATSNNLEGYPFFIHVGIKDISQQLNEHPDFYPVYIISTRISPGGWLMDHNYEVIIDTPSIDLYRRR